MREAIRTFDEVVIADPALSGNAGHYLAYATEVGAGIEKAGYRFRAIGTGPVDRASVAGLRGIDSSVAFSRNFNSSLTVGGRKFADWIFGTEHHNGIRGA